MRSKREMLEEAGLPFDDDESTEVFDLGPNQGGRKKGKKGLVWEFIRVLKAPDDLPLLHNTLPARRANLTQIRHTHHQLARLLAEGKSQTEASLITGYNPSYISVLKTDPSFMELMTYYSSQGEQVFVDVFERMRSLGLSTLDELQTRLETDPDSYSLRELMEQAELMLIKPMTATRSSLPIAASGGANSHGVQVNVNFVKSDKPSTVISASPDVITIDHE